MNMLELKDLYNSLCSVAIEINNKIDNEHIEMFLELISHSEIDTGVEWILSEIEDKEVVLSRKSYDILMKAAHYSDLHDWYDNDIKYEKE